MLKTIPNIKSRVKLLESKTTAMINILCMSGFDWSYESSIIMCKKSPYDDYVKVWTIIPINFIMIYKCCSYLTSFIFKCTTYTQGSNMNMMLILHWRWMHDFLKCPLMIFFIPPQEPLNLHHLCHLKTVPQKNLQAGKRRVFLGILQWSKHLKIPAIL